VDIYQMVTNAYRVWQGEKIILGKSRLRRNIYAFKIGAGAPVGLAQYALHGREWITAKLALLHLQIGIEAGSFWIVPLSNPDGALLSQIGLSSVSNASVRNRLLIWNKSKDFSLWKANANGVDLNVNFAARWGTGAKNTRIPGGENYIGTRPFSEPESKALARFTLRIRPDFTISYHTKGEEIYWYFHQSLRTCPRDKRLAVALSRATGYPLRDAKNSVGGYKDWCIERCQIPAFTIEAGSDALSHPIGDEGFENIRVKNERVLNDLMKEYLFGI
jgi:g-D-glutamyl-meso-diaminopimelate peptidase